MPDVPKGATVPEDHKKPAAQIEAEGGGTTTIEFEGVEYTFPSEPQDWSADTLREFEHGRAVEGCYQLIGPVKWNKLGMGRWSGRRVNALFEKFAEAAGLESRGN